tara:strand:- start:87 stop:374 length:288 start_codon:yes stop_codon:yes gene_type:complete
MVKVGKYNYEKSTRKGKKLMVTVKQSDGKQKTIHFGSAAMEHFKDKTGIWKSKDHLDKDRRKNYKSRSSGIKNKKGELTYTDPNTANYHSYNVLW